MIARMPVTLANKIDAALVLCDEFNCLGLIHASLVDTWLVTTPTLLSIFVRTEQLIPVEARAILNDISISRRLTVGAQVLPRYAVISPTGCSSLP